MPPFENGAAEQESSTGKRSDLSPLRGSEFPETSQTQGSRLGLHSFAAPRLLGAAHLTDCFGAAYHVLFSRRCPSRIGLRRCLFLLPQYSIGAGFAGFH
jgi:hypothetical protein